MVITMLRAATLYARIPDVCRFALKNLDLKFIYLDSEVSDYDLVNQEQTSRATRTRIGDHP